MEGAKIRAALVGVRVVVGERDFLIRGVDSGIEVRGELRKSVMAQYSRQSALKNTKQGEMAALTERELDFEELRLSLV